ncbi:hypothetical protein I6F50_05380 [Pseudoalteromonas sp. NZS127_1]|uniref:hypothetical protein n=1 Tax=unclassified Pseudoalteromonas TaxID=194690 RepID=UPI0013FD512A|nr:MULTISPECIES: hypothetical protein [unclassified Pseudoalteromonas]MBG9994487.1 hypothetical protein [Pseudoalteromonas sp. NZS127_1]MBH0041688.1 hypothetical protein [Pseudoalteromonas sp. SWXJZ10B]
MTHATQTWLVFSAIGFIFSLAIISLFETFTSIRFISNEGIVFGVMCSSMGFALKRLESNNQKQLQ